MSHETMKRESYALGLDLGGTSVKAVALDGDALVAQDPRRMGRETLTAAVHHLRGMPVAPLIDTGAVVVTRENVDRPEIQKILQLP